MSSYLLIGAAVVLAAPLPVGAAPPRRALIVGGAAACPSPASLKSALRPVLRRVEVVVGDDGGDGERVLIENIGPRHRVKVAGVTREFSDGARNCRERARAEAVFVAVTLDPPSLGIASDRRAAAGARITHGTGARAPIAGARATPIPGAGVTRGAGGRVTPGGGAGVTPTAATRVAPVAGVRGAPGAGATAGGPIAATTRAQPPGAPAAPVAGGNAQTAAGNAETTPPADANATAESSTDATTAAAAPDPAATPPAGAGARLLSWLASPPFRLSLEAAGRFELSPDATPFADAGLAGGGSLRLFAGGAHLAAGFGVTGLSPSSFPGDSGTARMIRVPFDLDLRFSFRRARFEIAADVGLVVAVVDVRGQSYTMPSGKTLTDAGARLGAQLIVDLGSRFAPFVALDASILPSHVMRTSDDQQAVGATPHAWLGLAVGVAVRLH